MVAATMMFRSLLLLILPLLSSSFFFLSSTKHAPCVGSSTSTTGSSTRLCYSPKDDDEKNDDSTAMLVELATIRLEHAHKQGFLKRKPRKLPYLEARRWVQSNLGAETKEEFDDMVANGNVRSPYLSKNPKVYYTETGDWISWEHFLTGYFEEQASGIAPSTGKFD